MTISARTVAKVILTAAAVVAGLYLLWLIRAVIGLVFMAIFLAVALGPAVDFFERRLQIGRALAIVATYLSLILVVVTLIGLLVVPPIVEQTAKFVENVPEYVADLRDNERVRDFDEQYDITPKLEEEAAKLPARFGDAASTLQSIVLGFFNAVITIVTVLVLTFFLLLDGRRVFEWVVRELGPSRGPRARAIAEDVYRSVGGYVIGNLTISLIAGLTTYLVLTLLGVPFAVPLAVLMAFLDLIPLVGASIAGFAIAIVAALGADFPADLIIWAVFFVDLPADREQRAPAADLPAHGRAPSAARDRRDPGRREPARDRRRAAGDPDRGRAPDRRQGLVGGRRSGTGAGGDRPRWRCPRGPSRGPGRRRPRHAATTQDPSHRAAWRTKGGYAGAPTGRRPARAAVAS